MTRHKILIIILLAIPIVNQTLEAQDIDDLLEEATSNSTDYTIATFKSTRILNGHSIERMPAGQLDFRISHRFGKINSGAYDFWGLDQASTHFSLEYGITDWVMVGLGRGTYGKTYDGFLKFSILRQSKGKINMPISLSFLTSAAIFSINREDLGTLDFWNRVGYAHQLLIGRKFNERISLEINPTFVHLNMVKTAFDPNDIWSIGGGGRIKITKRISFNVEYYYILPPDNDLRSSQTYNPLSIGFDIETGGHVFQLIFTNSEAIIEKDFITNTVDQWKHGDIYFGFNITRVFALTHQK